MTNYQPQGLLPSARPGGPARKRRGVWPWAASWHVARPAGWGSGQVQPVYQVSLVGVHAVPIAEVVDDLLRPLAISPQKIYLNGPHNMIYDQLARPHISGPKILVGKPVIKGTRLAVEFVIDLLANGWTESEILQNYPKLTHEDIQACLCYASSLMKSKRISCFLRRMKAHSADLDKDFGELTYRSKPRPSCGIILFRISLRSADYIGKMIVVVLDSRSDWPGHFAIVELGRIRLREL